jgi:hypothetical protein
MSTPPKLILLIVLNIIGVASYLATSSRTWIEPELRGEAVATGGDAIVWATTAFPIAVAFVVADSVIFVVASVGLIRTKKWKFNPAALAIPALWVAGFLIDRAHH